MAGQTHTELKPGDRCIIYVDDMNRPTGWWWGVVDSVETLSTWNRVTAHITGPFGFEPGGVPFSKPMYGDANIKPTVNYEVFGADPDTVTLVRRLQASEKQEAREIRRLRAANNELRALFKSMAMTPDTIVEAVRKALREQ